MIAEKPPKNKMDSSPLPQKPNPNPSPKNVYQISGVPVEFPYKPYGTQLAFMGRVISTLDRAKRQGHCHALLESPTGTGKSLSLLCSALAWQHHHPRRFPQCVPNPGDASPNPDPLAHGGGFIPDPHLEPSMNSEEGKPAMSARARRKLMQPKIYYASRTHSQISQVIREYRKTPYRVPMAVLGSRKHYCTNKRVCMKANIDEECKYLLKDDGAGCPEFKNAHKVKSHSSLQKGGAYEVHDIEDLVKVGRTVKGCSYFASQTLAEEAQLVFCPYSYIINPIVRRAMDIDIKGSIVILDEAHNIEEMARDAGSLDVEEDDLYTLQTELGQLCMNDSVSMTYRPLYDMIQGIIGWIADRKNNLQKHEFEHYSSRWTGDKAISELQLAGVTHQCFPLLQECATKAIKAVSDAESEGAHLSGTSAITLERIFSSLGYLFSGNGCHTFDYQLVLQRYVTRDTSNAARGWTCLLSMWCLNPAVVFRDIADLSLSVILTSGTLSPMGSFTSELGVQFEACMEAPHVIDVESQLWAAVISSGPENCRLNASYKTADNFAFQDSLGASLEEICKIVPGGALVFFPSYKLLEKLRLRWCQTGQWSRLNAQKPVFVEPRGNTDEFEAALGGYYDSVCQKGGLACRKSKSGLKQSAKHQSTKQSLESSKGGAAFLAVCRGKVSEGIDFADENARVVVIVGIPFPNTNDIQVLLKKRYNDTYKSARGLLSGSDWYCHQAFRALNQAAGRCIRHRFDYGAIILLDERLKEQRNLNYISKWIRNSIKEYTNFEESMDGLRNFFEKKRLDQKVEECEFVTSDTDEGSLAMSEPNLKEWDPQKKNQKQKKLNRGRRKTLHDTTVAGQKIFPNPGSSLLTKKDECLSKSAGDANEASLNRQRECSDLECSSLMSRCSALRCKNLHTSSLDHSPLHIEIDRGYETCKPGVFSDNVNFFSRTAQSHNQTPDGQTVSCCTTISNGVSSEDVCNTTSSPERVINLDLNDTEQESLLNKSVNSYNQRKRKQSSAQDKVFEQIDGIKYPNAGSGYQFDSLSTSNTYACQRIGSSVAGNYSDSNPQNHVHDILEESIKGVSPIPSDISAEQKLHICCLFCKNPLGLRDDNFLVPCTLKSSSKGYLSYIFKNGPSDYRLSECFSGTSNMDIRVMVSDISSINQHIFGTCTKEDALQHDVWCEEDGCVFRTVFCPFCTVTCLGVKIKATDAANVHLLNKVIFFSDHLYIKDKQTPIKESTMFTCENNLRPNSASVDTERDGLHSQHNDSPLNRTKSKLKLPSR